MADNKNEPLELDNSSKKKKLIIIIVAVVVLLGAGGGAFMFMGGDDISQQEMDAALGANESPITDLDAGGDKVDNGSALYVPMPRPFRFHIPGSVRDRFVEIRVQLLVRGTDNDEEAKKHVPLIESTLLNVFAQSNADDLSTSAGKTSLKQQSLKEVQRIMMEIAGKKVVEDVLFTGFVMQ